MKKVAAFTLSALVMLNPTLRAADTKISGEAMCAKCALTQTDSCQMAIKYKNAEGKEETILAENNRVAKDFHDEICKRNEKVNAEGTVTEKNGVKTITLSKVEKAQ